MKANAWRTAPRVYINAETGLPVHTTKKDKNRNIKTEDVIMTYVRPIGENNNNNISQCYFFTKNGYAKVGVDIWRELDYHDIPSHPVRTYDTLGELAQHYEILDYLKYERGKKISKIIYKEERLKYGLSG